MSAAGSFVSQRGRGNHCTVPQRHQGWKYEGDLSDADVLVPNCPVFSLCGCLNITSRTITLLWSQWSLWKYSCVFFSLQMINCMLAHSVNIHSVSLRLLSSNVATATDEEQTKGLSCCVGDTFPSNDIEDDSKLFVLKFKLRRRGEYWATPVDFFFSHEKDGNDLWCSHNVDLFLQLSLLAEPAKEQRCVCLSVYGPVSPPPGLFLPRLASVIGANLKYSDYSEGSELKRKEAQEEEKDEAVGSSFLSLFLLLPPLFPLPSPGLQLALGFSKKKKKKITEPRKIYRSRRSSKTQSGEANRRRENELWGKDLMANRMLQMRGWERGMDYTNRAGRMVNRRDDVTDARFFWIHGWATEEFGYGMNWNEWIKMRLPMERWEDECTVGGWMALCHLGYKRLRRSWGSEEEEEWDASPAAGRLFAVFIVNNVESESGMKSSLPWPLTFDFFFFTFKLLSCFTPHLLTNL